jgi:hypothetical protein
VRKGSSRIGDWSDTHLSSGHRDAIKFPAVLKATAPFVSAGHHDVDKFDYLFWTTESSRTDNLNSDQPNAGPVHPMRPGSVDKVSTLVDNRVMSATLDGSA